HEAKDPAEAALRTLRAIEEGVVKTLDGNDTPVGSESVCVHSDTPGAVEVARAVFDTIRPHLNRAA
ncbi:MAG: LamB/YcsF family protein, partial [Alphaproteobacteria bacterium]